MLGPEDRKKGRVQMAEQGEWEKRNRNKIQFLNPVASYPLLSIVFRTPASFVKYCGKYRINKG